MKTVTVTIPAELQAAFYAAHASYLAAAGSRHSDYPAWCREIATSRRAMAEVYAAAREALPEADLLWHAVAMVEDVLRRRARDWDARAGHYEQEGGDRR